MHLEEFGGWGTIVWIVKKNSNVVGVWVWLELRIELIERVFGQKSYTTHHFVPKMTKLVKSRTQHTILYLK